MTKSPISVIKHSAGVIWSDDGASTIGGYNFGATIACGLCKRELYSIFLYMYQQQPTVVYLRSYSYQDAYPYKSTVTTKTTIPWVNEGTVNYQILSVFTSIEAYSDKGAVTFPFAGYPKWDTAGNILYIPYTGCTNVNGEAHQNYDACYPMGKQTKVHIYGNYSINNYYGFIGDTSRLFRATCADCRKDIITISTYESTNLYPRIGDRVRTNINSIFPAYNFSGQIAETSSFVSLDVLLNSQKDSDDFREVNLQAYAYGSSIQNTKNQVPWGTLGQSEDGKVWWSTTTPIDFPFSSIPWKKWDGVNNRFIIVPKPYRGCPYCGTFGTSYTCGEVEDTTPDCNQVVTSIVPEEPIQTIYHGNTINTRAVVTYLDGSTASVMCSTTFIANTVQNNQIATITYTGMINSAKTVGTISTTITVNVLAGLKNISVVPSATTVYNGTVPTYKAEANYMDGTKKIISLGQYTMSGWSSGYGTKTVTFTYTDSGKTVTASVTIVVKPNLTNLLISANKITFFYGEDTTFNFTAEYEDGSKKNVAADCIQNYDNKLIGTQTVAFSYSENGITKTASGSVIVRDYPVSINISLAQNWIYQGQRITLQSSIAKLASGKEEPINPVIGVFDNVTLGSRSIIFSYVYNDRSVSVTKGIEIKPDLYDIQLSDNDFTIYRGQSLELSVMAHFNVGGNVTLDYGDYVIKGFDNNVYDRTGKTYTLTYTNRGVEISKPLTIKVLPNIEVMSMSATDQTTEGIIIPFSVEIIYEDGQKKTLTEADTGDPESGLSIDNYDPDLVGYQDIQIEYLEGGKKLSQTARIRVRAMIKISIPISALISINPNVGKAYAPTLIIENHSKESVVVGINSVHKGDSDLIDALPNKYSDWSKLGKHDSKYIAIGFDYASDDWMEKLQTKPLFISEAYMAEIGKINKESASSLKFQIRHGNSFERNAAFQYVINWVIRLAEE